MKLPLCGYWKRTNRAPSERGQRAQWKGSTSLSWNMGRPFLYGTPPVLAGSIGFQEEKHYSWGSPKKKQRTHTNTHVRHVPSEVPAGAPKVSAVAGPRTKLERPWRHAKYAASTGWGGGGSKSERKTFGIPWVQEPLARDRPGERSRGVLLHDLYGQLSHLHSLITLLHQPELSNFQGTFIMRPGACLPHVLSKGRPEERSMSVLLRVGQHVCKQPPFNVTQKDERKEV